MGNDLKSTTMRQPIRYFLLAIIFYSISQNAISQNSNESRPPLEILLTFYINLEITTLLIINHTLHFQLTTHLMEKALLFKKRHIQIAY
jgi:hypothetical protein